MIRRAIWNTLQLIIWGIIISTIVALFVGVYSAMRQYSPGDYMFTGLAFIGIAMPPFWFGLIAYDFAIKLSNWFNNGKPVLYRRAALGRRQTGINWDYVRHLVLPIATLTVQIIASWSRYQRASMLDVLSADYIRTAQGQGRARRKVIFKHGLRNALIPFVTVMALDIGALFGGLIITETDLLDPGHGAVVLQRARQSATCYVLVAWMIVIAIFIIFFNLLADLLYGVLDPRIRLS